jgi:CRISPR/Cas system CMR-associated protein Cmr5 small subunit
MYLEKLIIYIDKVGGKNDDCVDIADAKVYVKEDDNNPDQPSKDELEKIKNQAVAAKNDAETAAKAAKAAKAEAEGVVGCVQWCKAVHKQKYGSAEQRPQPEQPGAAGRFMVQHTMPHRVQ